MNRFGLTSFAFALSLLLHGMMALSLFLPSPPVLPGLEPTFMDVKVLTATDATGLPKAKAAKEKAVPVTADTADKVATLPEFEKLSELKSKASSPAPMPAPHELVTSMPVLISEVRVPYPPQAKQAGIEGPVVMDLIIDPQGKVQESFLIQGPGHGLDEAALAAIRDFRFHPAKIKDQAVAVQIRYTYRFVLKKH